MTVIALPAPPLAHVVMNVGATDEWRRKNKTRGLPRVGEFVKLYGHLSCGRLVSIDSYTGVATVAWDHAISEEKHITGRLRPLCMLVDLERAPAKWISPDRWLASHLKRNLDGN